MPTGFAAWFQSVARPKELAIGRARSTLPARADHRRDGIGGDRMLRRAGFLAALLMSAAPLSAHAQMFEIKVQFTNNAAHNGSASWYNLSTGTTKPLAALPSGQTTEMVDYWQPSTDAPTQDHVLTVTLPGNRACRAALRVQITYAMPGVPAANSFACSMQEQSSHNLSCGLDAVVAPAAGSVAGSCTATIRFGG